MILSNQLKCTNCGDTIFSATRHDYVECSCGKCMVDGGQDYLRRSASGFEEYLDITMDDKVLEECKVAVIWGQETGRNPLGIVCAIMRALRKHSTLDVTNVRGREESNNDILSLSEALEKSNKLLKGSHQVEDE